MTIVYDNPETGETARVTKQADGSFYGDTGDFDFTAKNEADLIAKLTNWGFDLQPVGYES